MPRQTLLEMLPCYTDGVTHTTRYRMIIVTLYNRADTIKFLSAKIPTLTPLLDCFE